MPLYAAAPHNEAEDILSRAQVKLESTSDKAHVTLKIIESSGEVKNREMDLQTLTTKDAFRAIVRMTAPLEYKGMALLTVVENAVDKQWLYLPANNQIRRVAVANRTAGVLGSELSPEDLNPAAIKGATVHLVKKSENMATIELIPPKGKSVYSRVVTTFSLPDNLPQKTEYFIGAVLQKVVQFQDYKSFEDNVYRAQKVKIKNVIKNRGTDIEFTHIKINSKFTVKDFSPESLKSNW